MVNPWAKKNPLLSMWLSGVNTVTGKARSAGAAEAKRQQASLAKQTASFWSGGLLGASKPKAKPKRAAEPASSGWPRRRDMPRGQPSLRSARCG